MVPEETPAWTKPIHLDIGRVLVHANGRALTAAEFQRALGRTHQSNVKRAAKELTTRGMLKEVPAERPRAGPGRPPQDAFEFADGEQVRFEELLEEIEEPREPSSRSEVVVVDTHEDDLDKGEALWRLLSRKGALSGARRVEQIEWTGEGAELRIEFDGPGAVDEAMDLMAKFQAAKLRVRRGRVSKSAVTADLREVARRRAEVIQRSREELGATQTRPRSDY